VWWPVGRSDKKGGGECGAMWSSWLLGGRWVLTRGFNHGGRRPTGGPHAAVDFQINKPRVRFLTWENRWRLDKNPGKFVEVGS
jgi:hypothetical protein